MENNTSIIKLFLDDHRDIEKLITTLKKDTITKKERKEVFKNMASSLLTHIRQEEHLYSKFKYVTGDILYSIQNIRKQHNIIKEELRTINPKSDDLKDLTDISGLLALLEKHKKIEENTLYPEIDKILTGKEKEELLIKMKISQTSDYDD